MAAVLRAIGIKNVVLMRELAFTCRSLDISPPAYLLIGLPMLGWAPGAEGLMRRMNQTPDVFSHRFRSDKK